MKPQLVDSHCHLPLIDGDNRKTADVVRDAQQHGVEHILCVCVQLESVAEVLATAQDFPNVFASVGVHPNTDGDAREPSVAELVALGSRREVVAVGETGLDYFRSAGDLEWQQSRFRHHIRAARELNKPLIIHSREAAQDVIAILRQERAAEVGGVMHCFVDDWDTASAAMDLGFYISLSGIVTFNSAQALREIAKKVPIERLLVETDAPWLAPVPMRGKQNEPAFMRHTAEFLADLRTITCEELARATTANFFTLFPATPVV